MQRRADDLGRDGLEEVSPAPRAVADIVAHQVGDHRGVAGVVLGNTHLHLAHQVGSHVGSLGVDAAAHLRKERHERRAEAEAHEEVGCEGGGRVWEQAAEEHAERGEAEDAQPDDQQAANCAAAQRRVDRLLVRPRRGRRGAHIGADLVGVRIRVGVWVRVWVWVRVGVGVGGWG